MPSRPAQFTLVAIDHRAPVEAAARRRMRGLESNCPAVLEWDVQVEGPRAGTTHFAARVSARIVGDQRLAASGRGVDALGALRLAFGALEQELHGSSVSARHRAARWLRVVRTRMGQGPRILRR